MITGIGHERDESIADLVAHTRQKTPTAVANYLIDKAHSFESEMEGCLTAFICSPASKYASLLTNWNGRA
ncbi:exodeoxyribonuclease VII large subunit [Pontibacter sp. BAB1700]|nr:exodeoxyribonuclease VII large subunit [Pontibacter sp. BAB1700]